MKKTLKILSICLLVWSCIFLVSGIGNIIRFAVGESLALFQRDIPTIFEIISCLIISPIVGLQFRIYAMKHQITFWYLFILILFGAEFAIGILEVCVRDDMVRVAWAISMWHSLGVVIFTAVTYIIIKRDESEDKRKKARQRKEAENKQSICEKLLFVAGMHFFVKYFDHLRRWNESDILDIIEESYSERNKRERIVASQKIFEKKLEQIALKFISESSKIDEGTVSIAKKLMESN